MIHKLPPDILQKGYELTTPSAADFDQLTQIQAKIIPVIKKVCQQLMYPIVDIVQVGSVQRKTFLPEKKDIDLFVRFKTDDRHILERFAQECIPEIAKMLNCKYQLKYAENPYGVLFLTMEQSETMIPVDVVATIWADSPQKLPQILPLSGMARTPFHNIFLAKKIVGLEPEVRLFKYWCKQKFLYGQNGFTGFLTELLTIIYKSFEGILMNAEEICHLKYDFHQRSEKIITRLFPNDKIIITDPIDPLRNAAAGIHGIIGHIKCQRFVKLAKEAFKTPQTLWDKYQLTEPYIKLTLTFQDHITFKNEDERFSRIARVIGQLNRQLMTQQNKILDALVFPETYTVLLQLKYIKAQKNPSKGPPLHRTENVDEFKRKHPQTWIEKGFIWTWRVHPSAFEIINTTLKANPLLKKYNIEYFASNKSLEEQR